MLPVESRQRPDENIIFFGTVPQEQTHTICLRLKSDTPIYLSFSILSMNQYLKAKHRMALFIGFFIGILLLAIGYYSSLYYRIKDKSFLYLSLAGLGLLFNFIASSEFAFIHIWPNYYYWNKISVPIFDALLVALFIKFICIFLELKKNLPAWYKVLQINLYLLFFLAVLVPLMDVFFIKQFIYLSMIFALILIIPVSFLTLHKEYKPAKFIFIGILLLNPASLYKLIIEFGLLPASELGDKGYLITSVFLIWFFTQAVSERIRLFKYGKEKAEIELHKSEVQLSLVIKGANLGIWDWDIKNNSIIHNERWAEMLGYTLKELNNDFESWKAKIHPDDKKLTLKYLNAHLLGKFPSYEAEYRLMNKFGNWIWVLDRGRVIEFDKKENPLRATGTIVDITKRKQAEESLRASEDKFSKIFYLSPDSISITSLETGKLIDVNQGFEDMFGYNRNEAIGNTVLELGMWTIPTDRNKMIELVAKNGHIKNFVAVGGRKISKNTHRQ